MAAENFKVKKGLEVGTAITATSSGINVTGILTATQLVGDGSGLTGVTGSGSGVIIKHDGSAVGTAGTINFSTNLDVSPIHLGIVTVTASSNPSIAGIDTSGTSVFNQLSVTGVSTFADDLNISSSVPQILLTDTDNDSDYAIRNANGVFEIKDTTNNSVRFKTLSNGITTIEAPLNVNGNFITSGTASVTGGSLQVGGTAPFIGLNDSDNNPDYRLYNINGEFQIYDSTNAVVRFNIKNNKVGFGTNNPARDFHVVGTSRFDQLDVVGFSTFGGSGTKFFHHVPRIEMQGSNTAQFQLTNATAGTTLSDGMVMGFSSGSQVGFINICESGHGFVLKTGGTATSAERINISGVGTVSLRKGNEEMVTAAPNGAVTLYFDGTQKLETTGTGIASPNISVSGVGTFSTRIDTNGVSFGTNSTTFAAKFLDDAVINVGTNNDLKIYHDDGNGLTYIRNDGTGPLDIRSINDINIRDGNDGDLFIKCEESEGVSLHYEGAEKLITDVAGVKITGVATATSFSGSAAGLTNIPSAQLSGALPALDGSALTGVTASGSGVVVKHDGSTVGTAGTINFSTNLDVSAISAGIVTVTASGGSATTINNNANNRLITASGTANTLEAEENLTYDGTTYFNMIGSGYKQFTMSTSTGNSVSIKLQNQTKNFTITNVTGGKFQISEASNPRLEIENGQVGILTHVNVTGVVTATTFSGALASSNLTGALPAISGANLTSLDAGNLGVGTIPNGRFPATLPAVSGANLTDLPVPTRVTVTNQSGDSTCNVLFTQSATGDQLPHTNANLTFNATNGTLTATTFSGSLAASNLTGALPAISGANLTGIAVTESPVTSYTILGSSSSPNYYLSGGGVDESDGNPDLYLIRGQRYRFNNTTGNGHPFAFRVASGGSAYTSGVTGSQNGIQFFTVPLDAPAKIVYQCTIHGGMVGNIYIRGAGGHNDNVGFTTFANKIEVKSSTNTAATFKGSGGAGFINITDADDGTLAFLGVDGGSFKIQTSGGSYSDKLIIDTTGNVTKPKSFHILVDRDGNQTGYNASNISDVIIWNRVRTSESSTGASSNFDTSTGLFTAPVTGMYLFHAAVNCNYNNEGAWLVINGSRPNFANFYPNGTASADGMITYHLTASDTVGIKWYDNGNTNATINSNALHTWWRIILLG